MRTHHAVRVMPLLLTLGLALSACHGGKAKPAAEAPAVLTVSVTPATLSTMTSRVELTGSIAAWDLMPVMPAANGLRVMRVLKDEGQHVSKGQTLATLDDASLQTQLMQAQARFDTSQANLASAQDSYSRFAELEREGGVSASDMVAKKSALASARADLANSRASVAQARVMLAQTQITAPDNGLIIARDVHLGDTSAVGKSMFTMVRDNRLELDALVPEPDLGLIQPGQAAIVTSDAHPDIKAAGRVRTVTPQLASTSREATAKIDLPANSGFIVGMFGRANILLGHHQVLAVPASAIQALGSESQVFVLDGQIARTRRVVTGDRMGDLVAITQGLRVGEPVIVNGVGFLKDGDKVTVAPENPASGAAAPGAATDASGVQP